MTSTSRPNNRVPRYATNEQWANLQSVAATGTAPPLMSLAVNANDQVSVAPFTFDAVGNKWSLISMTSSLLSED